MARVTVTAAWVLTLIWGGMRLPDVCGQGQESASPDGEARALIDAQVQEAWQQSGLKPSPPATEGEWCRRVHLDLLGRIPTVDELQEYLRDRAAGQQARLVARLLGDDYAAEYARNWTTHWTNLLLGRSGGTQRNDLASREGLQQYLREQFQRNRPYDELVGELLTAHGATVPGQPDFNGATNFLVNKLGDQATLATTRTSQLFLGMQVQCTQCHNHPFNEWKQNQFWELNAFFRQTRALRRFHPGTRDVRFTVLTDEDFAGEGDSPESAEIYYELRNGLLEAAFPVFIDGTPLENRSGYLEDVNRRHALAEMILKSDQLSLAVVNRLWGHFLGYGFTKPVDDMGPHNPASHPLLLHQLAGQFRAQGYNLKALMRWIVLSAPYGLASRMHAANAKDDPQLGEPPRFSRFYLRQMRPEELYESLLIATRADRAGQDYAAQESRKTRWLQQFVTAFGTDEGGESTTFNGSIPQALMMFNGDLMQRATGLEPGSWLFEVSASSAKPAKKIEQLYLAALARRPTAQEMRLAEQLVRARAVEGRAGQESRAGGNPVHGAGPQGGPDDPLAAALQDIWWALLNSNEFIINH